jgi:hypothetical protein
MNTNVDQSAVDTKLALQAETQRYSDEIAELEEKLLRGLNPTERLETEVRLKRLERALLKATVALSVASTNSELQTEVRRLDGKVSVVSGRQDTLEQKQVDLENRLEKDKLDKDREMSDLRSKVDQLLEENQARKAEQNALKQTVNEVIAEQKQTRRTVDAVDNRQRKQCLILHGLRPDTAKEDLLRLLPSEVGSLIDNVHPITKIAADGSVAMSVQFMKVSACEQARDLIASRDFKTRNGDRVRCAQDESELTRVGGSRLRAITGFLQQKFGDGLEVKRDFVRLGGVKYLAAEFARRTIMIGTTEIDIDEAVNSNPEAKSNPSVRTYIDGRNVVGVRLPRKRRNGDDNTPPPATRANKGRPKTSNEGRPRPNLTRQLPTTDSLTSGNVRVFNRGNRNYGGGRARDMVMRVSYDNFEMGQPSRFF